MPYNDGTPTKQERIATWNAGGRVGPHPCPPAKTQADREVRREIDALNKELKRGRWAPRVLSDIETAALAERKRLRRAAVIQRGIQRAKRGPTQQAIAESWLARGRPSDEPVPALIQQRAAAKVRWDNKRKVEAAIRRLERATASQVQRGGRPDSPLTVEAWARLTAWFAVWDACLVPDGFDDEPVRYGLVRSGSPLVAGGQNHPA